METKQELDLNLYLLEQNLWLMIDSIQLDDDIKQKILDLNKYIYKKLYKDIKGKDIVSQKAILITKYEG